MRVLDIALTRQPARTCAGVAIGVFAFCLTPELASPVQWIVLSVLLAHIPTMLAYVRGPAAADRNIARALRVVAVSGFSSEEKRRHYHEIVAAVYESVAKRSEADAPLPVQGSAQAEPPRD